jgi:hypothetical protein
MNHRHRLEQLHLLLGQLERLPASPNRDWMMVEVRARAADVETGVETGPVRQRNRDDPEAPPSEAAREDREAPRRDAPPSGMPAARRDRPSEPHRSSSHWGHASVIAREARSGPAGDRDRVDLLERGGVLNLGDPPAEATPDAGYVASPPWARGLRG